MGNDGARELGGRLESGNDGVSFPIPFIPLIPAVRSAQNGQNVVLAHDLVFDAFELVRAARVLAVDDLVADLDLGRAQLAVVQRLAFTDGDHFTLGRLFLGVVGDDDAAGGNFVGFDRLDDHARSEEHTSELQSLMRISYAVFCLKKKIKKTTNKIELFKLTMILRNE